MKTLKYLGLAFILFLMSVGTALAECVPEVWELTAGQYTDVGYVSVTNDADKIYVTYTLEYPEAVFCDLHLWIGNNLLNVPSTPGGTPIPGQFCQAAGGSCFNATGLGLTSYTFEVALSDLGIENVENACGVTLYVFTHATVCGSLSETAWGGNIPVDVGEPGRWYYYDEYEICCDFEEPPTGIPYCQTAFAKGGWVFVTSNKANPEQLPSLDLIKNRWGWAIKLTAVGSTTYDIWAGAGLNDTSKGTLVGNLTVNWDGSNVTVTYEIDEGYDISEVHIYAGDDPPNTTAPGQYGYVNEFDPNATSHSITLPLTDSNGGGVWLIAHAVVCTSE